MELLVSDWSAASWLPRGVQGSGLSHAHRTPLCCDDGALYASLLPAPEGPPRNSAVARQPTTVGHNQPPLAGRQGAIIKTAPAVHQLPTLSDVTAPSRHLCPRTLATDSSRHALRRRVPLPMGIQLPGHPTQRDALC